MSQNIAVPEEGRWILERYRLDDSASQKQGAGSVGAGQGLDLAALIQIIIHARWLIAGATALGLVLAILVTLLTSPVYRAWVTLEVNPPAVEIMDEKSRERSSMSGWDFINTQVGLLSSRSIAERTVQDMNLANDPQFVDQQLAAATRLNVATSKVAAGLKVKSTDEGQLIRFSFDAQSPQLAAAIANQMAESFIKSNLQRRFDASSYARTFLERQIAKTRRELEKSERQLVAYAQAQGIISTSSGSEGGGGGDTNSLQGASLVALNAALAEATSRRVAAEGAYRQRGAGGTTTEVNTSTQTLRQARAAVEAEYQEKRTLMKPEHPDMLSLRSRLDELDRQIRRETSQVSSGRSNTLLADYRSALAAERALQQRVTALKGSVLDLRGRSIQYTILQRDVDTNRSLYDALLQRYKEVGVAAGVGSSPVSIVDRAQVPDGSYKPNLIFNLVVGLLAGLLAGLGLAVALEYLYDVIKTREDVRNKLGLPCLGTVPKTIGKENFVEELKDSKSIVSESYSSVAASLRFSTEEGLPRTLLVTSSKSGEGKSSTSLALAQNFSRRGAAVLLIDCDLRKPAFKAASGKVGLTRLLTSERENVRDHVLPTQFPNLWILPSGPLPPNPADLLSTKRFKSILAELADHFEMIICDAPPVLGLADPLLLAPVTSAVMFVVESGKTRTKAAQESLGLLKSTGANVVGCVLNKAAVDMGGYGYKSYGYGSLDRKRTEILMIPHERAPEAPAEAQG